MSDANAELSAACSGADPASAAGSTGTGTDRALTGPVLSFVCVAAAGPRACR